MTKERLWSIRSTNKEGNPNTLQMAKEEELGDILLEMLMDERVYDIGIKGVFVG